MDRRTPHHPRTPRPPAFRPRVPIVHPRLKFGDPFVRSDGKEHLPRALFDKLKAEGAVVVPGVVDTARAAQLFANLRADILEWTAKLPNPIDILDPHNDYFNLGPSHAMLLQHYGIGHLQTAWDVRQDPRVVALFAALWSLILERRVSIWEMLASFDGMSIHLPPETTGRGWFRKLWMHTDQKFKGSAKTEAKGTRNNTKIMCIQGMVTLRDMAADDATFVYVRGSHLYHAEFAAAFPNAFTGKDAPKFRKNWFKYTDEQLEWFLSKPGAEVVRVTAKAGDVILWDSRTAHCGAEPLKTRKKPNTRAVIYTCYMPLATDTRTVKDTDLKKRIANFLMRRTTPHWPYPSTRFPAAASTFRNKDAPAYGDMVVPYPVITELGRYLVATGLLSKKFHFLTLKGEPDVPPARPVVVEHATSGEGGSGDTGSGTVVAMSVSDSGSDSNSELGIPPLPRGDPYAEFCAIVSHLVPAASGGSGEGGPSGEGGSGDGGHSDTRPSVFIDLTGLDSDEDSVGYATDDTMPLRKRRKNK